MNDQEQTEQVRTSLTRIGEIVALAEARGPSDRKLVVVEGQRNDLYVCGWLGAQETAAADTWLQAHATDRPLDAAIRALSEP